MMKFCPALIKSDSKSTSFRSSCSQLTPTLNGSFHGLRRGRGRHFKWAASVPVTFFYSRNYLLSLFLGFGFGFGFGRIKRVRLRDRRSRVARRRVKWFIYTGSCRAGCRLAETGCGFTGILTLRYTVQCGNKYIPDNIQDEHFMTSGQIYII